MDRNEVMRFIIDILKGCVMGIANVIPGVSGGTMAVAMGIYDKLIGAITHLFKDFKKSFMTVLPIGIGMIIGIVGLSMVIDWMFGTIPIQTNLLFIGLILGGVPSIIGRVKGHKTGAGSIVGFIIFFAIVVGLSFLQQRTESEKAMLEMSEESVSTEENQEYVPDIELSAGKIVVLAAVGVIASATMVVPGVSGSMMLMLLGYYTIIIGCISGAVHALSAGQTAAILKDIGVLVPFGIGVVVGIIVIAKIIEFLLEKHEGITFWCILGLIIGSPIAIIIVNIDIFREINVISVLTGILTFVVGFVIAFFLGKDPEKAPEEKTETENK